MAYHNGSFTSLSGLRSAFVDICTDNGWSWNSSTQALSKDGLRLLITISSDSLSFLGQNAAGTSSTLNSVSIGRLCTTSNAPSFELTFPAEYHIMLFTDPDEVYLVVRYDIDVFQFAAFGKSDVAGLTGSGLWLGASRGGGYATPGGTATGIALMAPTFGGNFTAASRAYATPALFWTTHLTPSSPTYQVMRNCFVHSGFDSEDWVLEHSGAGGVGVAVISELLNTQPSSWNSEAALIPIRAYKRRPNARVSLVADLVNARHIRVDNYEPGQILTLGGDRWIVFPWLLKNTAARNGSATNTDPGSINHSGTFGWAIRYEGP